MSERRLISTQRTVPADAAELYERAWSALRDAAGSDVRAWRYRSAADSLLFIEFLEFGGEDPRGRPGIATHVEALDRVAVGRTQEWRDATSTTHIGDR
ncbi:MAG TPA: hypothetical protein VMN39_04670 [Longimicrobiaceae bacterium]|nr:hypothetical protein [Longimicrobiaceae bacterium]